MRFVFLFLLITVLAAPVAAAPITYQGQLQQQGQPFSGTANLDLRLFDAAAGGNQIGPLQERLAWPISDGLFHVELDFGANAFDGSARFLEVRVNGTPLTPRQAVTATPQALIATTTVAGAIGTSQINATQVQRRVTGSCPAGQYIQSVNQAGTVVCGSEPPSWRLGGNAGTSSATHFIGTTDNQALELRTANARSLRIEPSAQVSEGLPITANVIAGSHANEVTPGVRGATIAGGGVPAGFGSDPDHVGQAPNQVTDDYGAVGGGYANQAGDGAGTTSDRAFATVGGGLRNTASAWGSTVAGGYQINSSGVVSTVGGGQQNTASGDGSTVGGGVRNTASGIVSTVGGGQDNTASGFRSTVGGGRSNSATGIDSSTVGGGALNTASGSMSTIGGGFVNTASGYRSTVSGGEANTASGFASTVSGGNSNCAGGSYSWAGGRRAKVAPPADPGTGPCSGLLTYPGGVGHQGTFIWADSQDANFRSTKSDQFAVRARGGVFFGTTTTAASVSAGHFISTQSGAHLTDGGVWTNASSRALKTEFAMIDPAEVLGKVLALPLQTWRYRSSEAVRHLGPMAEDFYASFGLGSDAESISTVDASGVALAAIQGLNLRLLDENAALNERLDESETVISDLEARLAALEALLINDRQVVEQLR